jgi:uncharacterized membrane protein YqjE
MTTPTADNDSLLATLRRLTGMVGQAVHFRVRLASLDAIELAIYWGIVVALGVLTGGLLFTAWLSLNALVVLLAWPTHPVLACVGLVVGNLLAALAVGALIWYRATHAPPPFAATGEELRRDLAMLGDTHE